MTQVYPCDDGNWEVEQGDLQFKDSLGNIVKDCVGPTEPIPKPKTKPNIQINSIPKWNKPEVTKAN